MAGLDGRRLCAGAQRRGLSRQLERSFGGRSLRAHPHLDAAERTDRCTPAQKADIVAYILNHNKFPAGKTELEPKTEVLKQIKIELKK